MSPSEVFLEEDWEIQAFYERDEDQPLASGGGEDWDEELLVPAQGRMVYVGQGESRYTHVHFHEPAPGVLHPKRKKKKKNARSSLQPPPPPPPPAAEPAPIDWSDWEELSQFSPPPQTWQPEVHPPSPRED
jgi:hypothetical protein